MIVYKATFPNGKMYIGCTIHSLPNRIKGHKYYSKKENPRMLVSKAIKKYGFENIKWEIIKNCTSHEDMINSEIQFISTLNTLVPHGYNLTKGGEGTVGFSLKGKIKRSETYKENVRKEQSLKFGKKVVLVDTNKKDYKIFNSMGEIARFLNIKYSIVKMSRKQNSCYYNYKFIDLEKFDSLDPKLYNIKNSANAIEFKIQRNEEIIQIKSINHLRKFLSISERQARNIYYNKLEYLGWKVV